MTRTAYPQKLRDLLNRLHDAMQAGDLTTRQAGILAKLAKETHAKRK